MDREFSAVKISETVYWVGAIDWSIIDFHGYSTKRGTTYNAFLILADKITLIDTVKEPYKGQMLSRIESVIPVKTIDYIVSNHSEMDHTGALPDIINLVSPEKIFASSMGEKTLREHFELNMDINIVKSGDKIDLGNRTLTFLETRMLHWPDSMFSYLNEEKILFSQDGFGMHLAGTSLFADNYNPDTLEYEAKKYYANILLPFSGQIKKLFKQIEDSGMEFNIIAPDHGPLWRGDDIKKIFGWYRKWCEPIKGDSALIIYDTMWGSTEKMARVIAEGIACTGLIPRVASLKSVHRSDIVTIMMDCSLLIIGSPTLNNNIFPSLADILYYIKGLKPKGLNCAAFGSYGWSGEAAFDIQKILENMKLNIIKEPFRVKYVPKKTDLSACREYALQIGKMVKEL
jgi:flavorubredoxin